MTLSLRHRILLIALPLLLLPAVLGGVGAALLIQLGHQSGAILRENYDSVRAMTALAETVVVIDQAFQLALAGAEEQARADYRRGWEAYRRYLGIEENNITIQPEEPRLVAQLQELTRQYDELGTAFFARAPMAGERRDDQVRLQQVAREILQVIHAIRALNEQQMQHASTQARDTAQASLIGLVVGWGATTAVAVLAAWWLHRAILGPIRSVTEAAQRIGGGQLELLVPVYGRDELGRLAEAFNAMTAKLRAYRQTNTERLLRAQQTGQATIDSFPDPIVVIDPEGRVECANPAAQRLFGVRPPEDQETRLVWEPPEALRRAVQHALVQQRPTRTETFDQVIHFHQDGDERQYLPQVHPIRSADGETLGAAVVLNDVTRFRLLDRLKSDWVATVSHELKTPLTSVRLAIHVLLEEVVGPLEPKQLELLLEARDNTERLLALIEHLLALAKLEDGREQLDLQPCDPLALLRTAAAEAGSRAEDRRIHLVVEGPPALGPVRADPVRLGRAINNLVDNALTYTEPGGRIVLAGAPTGDGRVRLSVSDTGIGIPAEHVPHVFDRFFRVPGREQAPGTGLGLAIVREVIEAHGGEVACVSELGRGTTFHLTLPLATEGA